MSKPTTNWDSVETWERLVASIYATGVKIDLSSVAQFYGTTYHTLENRMRKIKKFAKELEDAAKAGDGDTSKVATGGTPKEAASTTPRKTKTPKKDSLETVANGRVKKTDSKTKTTTAIKEEPTEDEAGSGERMELT